MVDNSYGRASLLDRLIDKDPWAKAEFSPLSSYNFRDYVDSVLKDLSFLFNTRSPTKVSDYHKENLTVINYGIPDFAHYSPESSEDQVMLAEKLEDAITVFEPRLRNPDVTIEPKMPDEKKLIVRIDAEIIFNRSRYRVSILTGKQMFAGKWEIYETKW